MHAQSSDALEKLRTLLAFRLYNLLDLLLVLNRKYEMKFASEHGLAHSHLKMLWYIYVGRVQTPTDASRWLHLKKSSVSDIIQVLERKGFIHVEHDFTDARRKLLRVTSKGKLLLHEFLRGILNMWFEKLVEQDYPGASALYGNLQHILARLVAPDQSEITINICLLCRYCEPAGNSRYRCLYANRIMDEGELEVDCMYFEPYQ